MTRAELQGLVRQIVAERLRDRGLPAAAAPSALPAIPAMHPSHAVYVSVVNVDDACVIEPSTRCDHCGYCKSHGH